jgi:CheY-like chemotaxis protein
MRGSHHAPRYERRQLASGFRDEKLAQESRTSLVSWLAARAIRREGADRPRTHGLLVADPEDSRSADFDDGGDMLRTKRIMVVEDDDDLRYAITAVLEDAGFEVTPIGGGEEALERLRAGGIRMVFLDLGLGGMTGREFMAHHTFDPALSRVPIVLLSGEPDLLRSARRLGAVAHMRKPFDAQRLVELARRFCANGVARAG